MLEKIFGPIEFKDRYLQEPDKGVDVIIPIIHTNELWDVNLKSIYREIPVKRIIISDGGCIDNSLEILKQYPRVEILDHKNFKSLGYCLRVLMESVTTEHFVYLHSDVYLSEGWFDQMYNDRTKFDWYECKQINAYLIEVPIDYHNYTRALSGGQIGRKAAFEKVLPKIDDDFLYRSEDIIFAELIKEAGFKYGRSDAILYHQIMNKRSSWRRSITDVALTIDKSKEEEIREWNTQARALIKYLRPGHPMADRSALTSIRNLIDLKQTTLPEFRQWVEKTPYGAEWLVAIDSHFGKNGFIKSEFKIFAKLCLDTARQFYRLCRVAFK